jgi:RNA polymerase sigma factor for flagellar operon FliA
MTERPDEDAAYADAAEGDRKEQVIREFHPFIRFTARRLAWRLPPGISEDDLISAGVVGLLDASRDSSRAR